MTKTKKRPRGETGSVLGIPEEEVTSLFLEIGRKLAKGGLNFTRIQATEAFAAAGSVEEGMVDALVASFLRTIPGLRNVGFGEYVLPEVWELAIRRRMDRFALMWHVLELLYIRDALQAQVEEGLGEEAEVIVGPVLDKLTAELVSWGVLTRPTE
jgi:hypothetical protein